MMPLTLSSRDARPMPARLRPLGLLASALTRRAAARPGGARRHQQRRACLSRRCRGLFLGQRRRADQLISNFENSTSEIHYCYVEALDDGRGYTVGGAGFTSATGDLLEVATASTFRPAQPA